MRSCAPASPAASSLSVPRAHPATHPNGATSESFSSTWLFVCSAVPDADALCEPTGTTPQQTAARTARAPTTAKDEHRKGRASEGGTEINQYKDMECGGGYTYVPFHTSSITVLSPFLVYVSFVLLVSAQSCSTQRARPSLPVGRRAPPTSPRCRSDCHVAPSHSLLRHHAPPRQYTHIRTRCHTHAHIYEQSIHYAPSTPHHVDEPAHQLRPAEADHLTIHPQVSTGT